MRIFSSYQVLSSPGNVDWEKRKIIVFQSDDWGLCGWCPDLEAYREVLDKDENLRYLEHGKSTLESPEDMERLFDVLLKYKGGDGRPPIFQAAYIMSNPDYDAIRESGCKIYSDLVIPEVPSRWQRGDFIAKAKEGIKMGLWHPVYHGNSHFNRFKWIKLIRAKDKTTMLAFKHQTFINMSDSYEYDPKLKTAQQETSISTGIRRFYDVFGYYPKSAICPGYVWQNKTEKILAKYGIKVIQGKNLQEIKRSFPAKVRGKLINWMGQKASDKPWQISMGDYNPRLKIYYLNRNVYFEPFGGRNPQHGAEGAYKGIVSAWERNEPAVVCTHRINYVYLDDKWVEESLNQLDLLLSKIQTEHPEAVYLTDWEVVQLYEKGTSTIRRGSSIICRNYSSSKMDVRIEIPQGYKVGNVVDLRRKKSMNYTIGDKILLFTADIGDYEVILQKEE